MSSLVPFSRRYPTNSFFDNMLFKNFFGDDLNGAGFRVDVKDCGESYDLEAEFPGVEKDRIEVSVDGGYLIITVNFESNEEDDGQKSNYVYRERRTGCFQRSFELDDIDENNISARLKDGILHLVLPKKEKERRIRRNRIEIET